MNSTKLEFKTIYLFNEKSESINIHDKLKNKFKELSVTFEV
mgnify:CR=1 FL=1